MSAFVAPQMTAQGPVVPSYSQYQQALINAYLSIYPANASLSQSDADYQFISAIALMLSDLASFCVQVLNSFSLYSASGVGQDAQYANLGIQRLAATDSQVDVTLTGTPGLVITNGVLYDSNGNLWSLPGSVTIGSGGTVTAQATTSASITAPANTVTGIETPMSGWVSVTNSQPSIPGIPAESDAAFRARAIVSTLLPSQTTFQATLAAVASVDGVVRSTGYNNPAGTSDENGNPPHSVTIVTQGGSPQSIAEAIYTNAGLGALTNGTTSVQVTDPVSGQVQTVSFDIALETQIYVTLNLAPLAATVTTSTASAVNAAVVAYLNSLNIGQTVSIAALYATAMSLNSSLSDPSFSVLSIQAGTSPSPTGVTDIVIPFDSVSSCVTGNVVVNTVTGP